MAKDFESGENSARVRSILDEVEGLNIIFVLTLHQLIEVLRHDNDQVAEQRLRFLIHLANRPNIGWIRSRSTGGIGSIIDVVAAEVDVCIRTPGLSIPDLTDEVRERIFQFGSPPTHDIVDLYAARPLLSERINREREVASLAFTDLFNSEFETVGDLRREAARSRDEAVSLVRRMGSQLESNLKAGGDKKLANPTETAQEFVAQVADELPDLRDGEHPADAILRYAGLDPDQVPDETPWTTVTTAAVFRAQLRVVKPLLSVDEKSVESLAPGQLPSFRVQEELRRRVKRAHRRKGSDLGDAHLAVLLWYFDSVVVDRRTHEYLAQIYRSDRELGRHMGRWIKLSRYGDLPSILRE